MRRRTGSGWAQAGRDAITLAGEAAEVVNARTEKLARGGADAWIESWLMVADKWQAAAELQAELFAQGPHADPLEVTHKTLALLRRKVKANGRRLRS